ncbi:MAG: hypothetical protein ACOYN0_09985 [Phycisphaerales bacterium]
MRRLRRAALGATVAGAFVLGGCGATPLDPRMTQAVDAGRYGGAREKLQAELRGDGGFGDHDYILNRSRLLMLTLADGQPDAAEEVANQTFQFLRTQGLNADRTIRSVVISDGIRIWKGDPFEQAMAYSAIAIQKAQRGEWDNARAAAQASLFLLKDFGDSERKGAMSSTELARRAAAKQQAGQDADAYLDKGYAAVKTNFALGYILSGVASKALGRDDEASDFLREAATLDPRLAPLSDDLRSGRCNTVVVVAEGRGPVKVATGLDGAVAEWAAAGQSVDSATVWIEDGGGRARGPRAVDVAELARDHRWNNLEDVRRAKSLIGNALMVGGAAVAIGAEDDQAKLAGAGAALAGLLLKASSKADTRYNEFLPRSVYVAAINVTKVDSTVGVQLDNRPGTRMLLPAISPPSDGTPVRLVYARLPTEPAGWASSGRVIYANDRTEARVAGDELPYIMGGTCVRAPTPQTLARYHASGRLKNMTAVELENLYREEGVTFTVEDQRGESRKHLLEGGSSLVCPLAGSTGYVRLFCQNHPPYRPKSAALQRAIEDERAAPAGARSGQ